MIHGILVLATVLVQNTQECQKRKLFLHGTLNIEPSLPFKSVTQRHKESFLIFKIVFFLNATTKCFRELVSVCGLKLLVYEQKG
jgi:hypothetical protein